MQVSVELPVVGCCRPVLHMGSDKFGLVHLNSPMVIASPSKALASGKEFVFQSLKLQVGPLRRFIRSQAVRKAETTHGLHDWEKPRGGLFSSAWKCARYVLEVRMCLVVI